MEKWRRLYARENNRNLSPIFSKNGINASFSAANFFLGLAPRFCFIEMHIQPFIISVQHFDDNRLLKKFASKTLLANDRCRVVHNNLNKDINYSCPL